MRCAPAAPLPLQLVHARGDGQVSFGGGTGGRPGTRYAAAEATLAAWARRNRCAGEPRRATQGNIDVVTYSGCAAATVGWFLNDWGHLPPKSSGPVFVAAIKQLVGRA